MTRLALFAVAVVGLVIGGVVALSARTPAPEETFDQSIRPTLPAIAEGPLPQPQRRVLLIWTPRALPPGLATGVSALSASDAVTTVNAGTIDLVRSTKASGEPIDDFGDGWTVPLDAFAVRPRSYARLLPAADRDALLSLREGRAVLGETAARLRRVMPGDVLFVRGRRLEVAAILDDTLVGGAEVVLTQRDARRLDIVTPRFLLVAYTGSRTAMERAIRRVVPPGISARVRGPGETPFLRHGDAVLPQALVKESFGEFAYRFAEASGREFVQDPTWVRDHITTATVPVLGRIHCHRALIPLLRGALRQLRQDGLGHLVDPAQFAGCWSPRLITEGGGVSRHAWGIAVDLNASANPTGSAAAQDPRLVKAMEQWGFTWGGFWLVPDAMHFEYARPPS